MRSLLIGVSVTVIFGLLLGCATHKTGTINDIDSYQDTQTFSSPSNYQSSQNASEVAATALQPLHAY